MGTRGLRAAVGASVLALLLGVGCAGGAAADGEVRIRVDKPVALADEPLRVRVTGLDAGQEVTVTSKAADHRGQPWTGRATFAADESGTVDLKRARPRSGTYRQADGMGLFWSMKPDQGPADESWFAPLWPELGSDYEVRLAVDAGGKQLAARTLTRTWMGEGVTHRPLTVAKDGVEGALYLPPAGSTRRPPVLLFGGSSGGHGDKHAAALLASRGHPALDLCYFGCAGRPATLERVELEYFVTAARLLKREYATGSQRPAVIGYSRGSEAAQLLAHHYPDLVHDVVVYAPSHRVVPGFPDGGPAWTKGGKPVKEGNIPLHRVRGTVLAVAGGDDGMWPSAPSAEWIGQQRGASGDPHRALIHPHAGHGVGTFPYTAAGTRFTHPVTGESYRMGGTAAANAQARAKSWPEVLKLLRG
ncbi:palmitoyl-CoA hydrolase [Streptomyces sp. SID4919]|uniref:acyl-CoA thioesterase/bile acid-CoA:amino acid N-acyltransferase family protein n=1 Tax=Streptomyces sp. SID4919 TaxID=2690270 RepID=UPI000823A1A3|nr:acyl-CoA thioesterase/bile acid-CoA:amino acid N-acyltransferase family protein [Streptomyces sp. SID4919]MYY13203.1 palmitoyl-CoA hydrolase [Streptomyces sp. SID4919]SCK38549.1 BAAT / Acyl-CoA thioester hydrolase C terminal [Streptomyces sp. AmelKG-E11A]